MTPQRETAEKLLNEFTVVEHSGCDDACTHRWMIVEKITAALEEAKRAGFDRGIEDAAKLVQSHGRYTLSGFIVSGTDLPKEIRALKEVKP